MSEPEEVVVYYFGPPNMRKDYETQIPVPIGRTCLFCEEPFAQGDAGTISHLGQATHHECMMRQVIGSVGHLRELCSCHGGSYEDPPEMTRRQAAIAAVELYNRML